MFRFIANHSPEPTKLVEGYSPESSTGVSPDKDQGIAHQKPSLDLLAHHLDQDDLTSAKTVIAQLISKEGPYQTRKPFIQALENHSHPILKALGEHLKKTRSQEGNGEYVKGLFSLGKSAEQKADDLNGQVEAFFKSMQSVETLHETYDGETHEEVAARQQDLAENLKVSTSTLKQAADALNISPEEFAQKAKDVHISAQDLAEFSTRYPWIKPEQVNEDLQVAQGLGIPLSALYFIADQNHIPVDQVARALAFTPTQRGTGLLVFNSIAPKDLRRSMFAPTEEEDPHFLDASFYETSSERSAREQRPPPEKNE